MLCSEDSLEIDALYQAVCALTEHHDALRMTFTENEHGEVVQYNRGITEQHEEIFTLNVIDLSEETQPEKRIAAEEKKYSRLCALIKALCFISECSG